MRLPVVAESDIFRSLNWFHSYACILGRDGLQTKIQLTVCSEWCCQSWVSTHAVHQLRIISPMNTCIPEFFMVNRMAWCKTSFLVNRTVLYVSVLLAVHCQWHDIGSAGRQMTGCVLHEVDCSVWQQTHLTYKKKKRIPHDTAFSLLLLGLSMLELWTWAVVCPTSRNQNCKVSSLEKERGMDIDKGNAVVLVLC